MSSTDDVATLTTRIQEYEKRETLLKEKLKEEHAQLVNFQKKLAQAGSHLKTLTQENSKLSVSVNNEKENIKELEKKLLASEESLKQSQVTHQSNLKQLVNIIQETVDDDNSSSPDVSDPTLFDSYIQSVKTKLSNKKPQASNEESELVKELKQEIEVLKSADHVENIESSLKSILKEPENATIHASLPPSMLVMLEQVRSTLQDQQEKLKTIDSNHQSSLQTVEKDLKRQITQLNISINELTEENEKLTTENEDAINQATQLEQEKSTLEKELEKTIDEKQKSQDRERQLTKEHQALLGKLSHIKETLTPRLEQDKQLRQKVSDLTQELEETVDELERCRSNMIIREEEHSHQVERQERTISELSSKLSNIQAEREEYEVLSNQLDTECHRLQDQLATTRLELEKLIEKMEIEKVQSESEKASLANLQAVLEEFQATKDAEMQAVVEHIERQLDVAKKSWAEYEERAHTAEAALEKYQQDVKKTQKYEQEIKEKNLLIGKLRHEAIILNEHLVEAMRKLKEETSESNVDRQLITNLLVGFFMAPRGDRKRFDILTIISNVLQLSEEQKEQIGLIRPKHSGAVNNISPTLPVATEQPQKESFTDAWISFLLKESSPLRRNRSMVSLPSSNSEDNTVEL